MSCLTQTMLFIYYRYDRKDFKYINYIDEFNNKIRTYVIKIMACSILK